MRGRVDEVEYDFDLPQQQRLSLVDAYELEGIRREEVIGRRKELHRLLKIDFITICEISLNSRYHYMDEEEIIEQILELEIEWKDEGFCE